MKRLLLALCLLPSVATAAPIDILAVIVQIGGGGGGATAGTANNLTCSACVDPTDIAASGTFAFPAGATVGTKEICLADGTNCPGVLAADSISIAGAATTDLNFLNSADITLTAPSGASPSTTTGVINANSVALTTDTTGNYVGTITGSATITSSGATSGEGITTVLSVTDDSITVAKIADGDWGGISITNNVALIGLGAIGSDQINDGSVAAADMTPSAVQSVTILDGSVAAVDMADAQDWSGKGPFRLPSGTAPTTTSTGQIAFDTNQETRGALQFRDSTGNRYVMSYPTGETLTDGFVSVYRSATGWRAEDPTSIIGAADITSVTAGTNLSGGGTSGAVTLALASSPQIVGTANATVGFTVTGGASVDTDLDSPANSTSGGVLTLKEDTDLGSNTLKFSLGAINLAGNVVHTPDTAGAFAPATLLQGPAVAVKTNSGSPHTITAAECNGGVIANTGAVSAVVYNLPAAVVGMQCSFFNMTSSNMDVNPDNADLIQVLGLTTSAGDAVRCSALGCGFRLVAIDAVNWAAFAVVGTVSDQN